MTEFAARFVASAMNNILPCRGQRLRKRMARQYLPYCIVHIDQHTGLFLNRNYKPLGWPDEDRDYIDYSEKQWHSLRINYDCDDQFVTKPDGQRFFYFYGGDLRPAPWTSTAAAYAYMDAVESFLVNHAGFD